MRSTSDPHVNCRLIRIVQELCSDQPAVGGAAHPPIEALAVLLDALRTAAAAADLVRHLAVPALLHLQACKRSGCKQAFIRCSCRQAARRECCKRHRGLQDCCSASSTNLVTSLINCNLAHAAPRPLHPLAAEARFISWLLSQADQSRHSCKYLPSELDAHLSRECKRVAGANAQLLRTYKLLVFWLVETVLTQASTAEGTYGCRKAQGDRAASSERARRCDMESLNGVMLCQCCAHTVPAAQQMQYSLTHLLFLHVHFFSAHRAWQQGTGRSRYQPAQR